MAEHEQRTWRCSNGDSCEISEDVYHVLKSMSDKSCIQKNPIGYAAYIEELEDQSSTKKGQYNSDNVSPEEFLENMSTEGRNPSLILEIKDLLTFVFDQLTGSDTLTICRLGIMEALPDKEVMQVLGINSQSTYSYKKQAVRKKLAEIGKKIPEYRGFWIPTPKEFYKPPRRRNKQANNNQEVAPVEK